MDDVVVGFIGQGYIGKNYADDFERRGFSVVRYALEAPYIENKGGITACDIVFIAVPTPTTPEGFDGHIVEEALGLVGDGAVAVIKSTIPPGTTKKLQGKYENMTVLMSPEFLSEVTAAHDAAHPFSNIIGLPRDNARHKEAAELVHRVLPKAPFSLTCDSDEAEIIKYAHNVSGYTQIVLFNLIYDLAQKMGHDWEAIGKALQADPLISNRYANPVHKSGRGAGGNCFIKDFAAFREVYKKTVGDERGEKLLGALEDKNLSLLESSGKDENIVKQVYGNI